MNPIAGRTIGVTTTTTDLTIVGAAALLLGWSFRETTGAAVAGLQLIDGSVATGEPIVELVLASGGTSTQWLGWPGLDIDVGLFLHITAGSVRGSVWLVPSTALDGYLIEQGQRPAWSGLE